MKKTLTIFFIATAFTLFAQQPDANEILNQVKKHFEVVKDYSVDLKIEIDMEFLRVPNVKAKAYFKQPDKMKIDSEDFAVLPKEGMNFSPAKLLNKKYSAIYVKEDTLDNTKVDVIKIIPLNDSSKIVLSTLWIEKEESAIKKIETTTKNRGTFQIKFQYGKLKKYGLPAKIEFTFINKSKKITAPTSENKSIFKKPLEKMDNKLRGNILIKYSNYKINQGLKDSFFDKENNTSRK